MEHPDSLHTGSCNTSVRAYTLPCRNHLQSWYFSSEELSLRQSNSASILEGQVQTSNSNTHITERTSHTSQYHFAAQQTSLAEPSCNLLAVLSGSSQHVAPSSPRPGPSAAPVLDTSTSNSSHAASGIATESPLPATTGAVMHRCTFCRQTTASCKEFPSKEALELHIRTDQKQRIDLISHHHRLHIRTDHKFRCQKGCQNVGFKCEQKRKEHHESLKHWPDNPPFGRPPGIECYRCGRCGKARPHRANHCRHVKTCKGGNLDNPVSYECARHGPTGFDKEEHLAHLKRCLKKTTCKTKSRARARSGRGVGEGSVPTNALTAGTSECHEVYGTTPETDAMTLESTPEVGSSTGSSAEATVLPRADFGVPVQSDTLDPGISLESLEADFDLYFFDAQFLLISSLTSFPMMEPEKVCSHQHFGSSVCQSPLGHDGASTGRNITR